MGPGVSTVRIERISGSHCMTGPGPVETDTLTSDHPGWTISIEGVLPNPADRRILKGSTTATITREGDTWLTTGSGAAAAPLQTRDTGELLPVPVEVTTTWDLRRRQ